MSELSPEGRAITRAINDGWIGRGFKLGIGFWLAGLFVIVASWFAVLVLGRLVGELPSPSLPSSAERSPAAAAKLGPTDPRSWQEQLRAQDAAARQLDRQR